MIIRKNTLWGLGIILVVVLAGYFVFVSGSASNSGSITGNTILNNDGDVQVVKIHVEGSQYILEPSSVKVGIPVRLEADMSRMPGCSKGIVSSELGISKTFSDADNALEFTPSKAGTFNIACGMNMYKGTLTVLQSDGTKSSYVQAQTSNGMSCGSGGSGGCGCGG